MPGHDERRLDASSQEEQEDHQHQCQARGEKKIVQSKSNVVLLHRELSLLFTVQEQQAAPVRQTPDLSSCLFPVVPFAVNLTRLMPIYLHPFPFNRWMLSVGYVVSIQIKGQEQAAVSKKKTFSEYKQKNTLDD